MIDSASKPLHRTAILLRYIAAGELWHYASSKQRGNYAIWENKEAKSKGHLA